MMDTGNIKININVFGVVSLEGLVIRHLAPLSTDAILNKLPIITRGRFSFGGKKYWTLPEIGIRKGLNSKTAREDVKAGEMVYSPKADEFIICLEDQEMPNKVNIVGKIISSNLNDLLKARNGLNTKISR